MIAAPTIGNADPEWPMPRPGAPQGAFVVQAIEAYPNPLPRKCVWAMLLLSCLLVLRVQQDRYAEVVHWRGGVPDTGNPFPWEISSLVSAGDGFEATFLSPILRKASTFVRPPTEGTTLITGLGRAVVTGSTGPPPVEQLGTITAMTSSADLPPPVCLGNGSSCYMGMQRATVPARALLQLNSGVAGQPVACHRIVAGVTPQALRPLVVGINKSSVLCMRSSRIQTLVRTNDSALLAWDPPPLRAQRSPKSSPACVAMMALSPLTVGPSLLVDSAATVLFDKGSNLVVVIGFSSVQTLLVRAYDPVDLKPLWKYRLPLSVAWLVRAPKVSNGFLLFVGSEEPFLGTIFTIDLKNSQVYEQDPPAVGGRRRPRRRRLPRSMVVERPSPSGKPSNVDGTRGPCAAVAVPEFQSAPIDKGNAGHVANTATGTGEKAGPPGHV